MKKIILKSFALIFFALAVFLFLPVLGKSNTVQALECGGAGCCSNITSGAKCQYTSNSCPGGYVDNYCPGASNYKCCLPTTTACYQTQNKSKCQTNPNGSQACNYTYKSGYCPGATNIQCCVVPTLPPPPPPPAPCGSPNPPVGTIISTGVQTSASSVYQNNQATYGPANAVDGVVDQNKAWNSGAPKPGWIEINLGSPQTVNGLTLVVAQAPNGNTIHQILTGPNPAPTTVSQTLSCNTQSGEQINVVFPTPLTNTQYIRINTPATSPSTSWVAWTEITVYGSAPGAQSDTPGVIFTGDVSANFNQDQGGNISPTDWLVGGLTYPEVYATNSNTSETSYQYLTDKAKKAGITPINLSTLSTCGTLTNCTLPSNLADGIYLANGDVGLNAYTFPTNRNYVFLINGNLTILGNIVVPNGSTAFFTSSNDIIVDKNVGTSTNLFPLPGGQVQGIFSADHDFTIDGINNCTTGKDKMLNVEGSIITNAAGNGGKFNQERDLCGDNPKYPTLTVRLRLDMLLNLPQFLMKTSTTLREDAP